MDSLKKYLPAFDVMLFTGLGCGALALCILGSAFVYLWQNLPGQRSLATQIPEGPGALSTVTPVVTAPFSTLTATATLSPPLVPTLEGSGSATQLPPFLPDFGGGPIPTGKIVYVCYINQIDQICIMNADGSGRRQLTNFTISH